MKSTEYTIDEMRSLLDKMSGIYDLARVVDPIECRILNLKDGKVSGSDSCYGIWNSENKCMNCSSALACRTGCHQEKTEHFDDKTFHIQSEPVKLKLPDGGAFEAVVELVTVEKDVVDADGANRLDPNANDRAAENTDDRATHYRAMHDDLTCVLNAGAFYEIARDAIVKAPETKRVMITADIKDFRLVNTLFGVIKGNEVLSRTGAALGRIAENAGGICGRLGGDQFALLIPKDNYSEKALLDIAYTLAEAFSSGLYTFCIHFGVYDVDDSAIPVSVMCDRANAALRTVKDELTKTIAYFDEAMMKKSLFEQEVISGFDEALKTGQFRMYLQSLVGEDGKTKGAEALVRWVKPDRSIVMPGDFIETLEHAGLIAELDMYIWECAAAQLASWKGTDKADLTISVNMSAKDFYSIDIYRILTDLVAKYDIESSKLRLEITETALLEEPEKCDAILSKLRDKGFIVEIDDFGKGHSSLLLLKDIQADVLKIDMSLLHEIETKERSRIIVGSVIGMANSLGMDVVTEGVETEDQFRSLSSMGCSHFQGFYFSKPVPVSEFEAGLNQQ